MSDTREAGDTGSSRDSGQDTLTDGSDIQSEVVPDILDSEPFVGNQTEPRSFIFPQPNSRSMTLNRSGARSLMVRPLMKNALEERSIMFDRAEHKSLKTNQSERKYFFFDELDHGNITNDPSDDETVADPSDNSKIVHCYVASRGQRERETDIYEVNPPPHFSLLSCDI